MTNDNSTATESKRFPKTDVRYWRDRLFKRSNEEWQVQIAYAGRQKRFPLRTANKDSAATKARDIYLSLNAAGWDATLDRFKPWTVEAEEETAKPVTVGQFIETVRAVAEAMMAGGVRGIWNFTPVQLSVPADVIVKREDLAASLAVLSHRLRHGEKTK